MKDYLIVHKSLLPDNIFKVLEVKQIITNDPSKKVSEVCTEYNLSRSTYYKYKDLVFIPDESFLRKAVISLNLSNDPGNLSKVLNLISEYHLNILTISQSIPIGECANVILSLDISRETTEIANIMDALNKTKGVLNASLTAIE